MKCVHRIAHCVEMMFLVTDWILNIDVAQVITHSCIQREREREREHKNLNRRWKPWYAVRLFLAKFLTLVGLERYQERYPIPISLSPANTNTQYPSVRIISVLLQVSTGSDQLEVRATAWWGERITTISKPRLVICRLPRMARTSLTLPPPVLPDLPVISCHTAGIKMSEQYQYCVWQRIKISPRTQYWQILGNAQYPNTSIVLNVKFGNVSDFLFIFQFFFSNYVVMLCWCAVTPNYRTHSLTCHVICSSVHVLLYCCTI